MYIYYGVGNESYIDSCGGGIVSRKRRGFTRHVTSYHRCDSSVLFFNASAVVLIRAAKIAPPLEGKC